MNISAGSPWLIAIPNPGASTTWRPRRWRSPCCFISADQMRRPALSTGRLMSQTPPTDPGIYVYCVAHSGPFAQDGAHFESPGIGGRGDTVRAVEWEDLVAIVSDSPKARYELRREYLMAHEHVVEEVMQR